MKTRTNTKYWIAQGYSEEDAKKEVKRVLNDSIFKKHGMLGETREECLARFYKDRSFKNSKRWFVNKYGETIGLVKWEEYKNTEEYKQTQCTRLEYWIKKCGGDIEAAKIKLKNRQTVCSKKAFQKRYGDEIGVAKYEQFKKRVKFAGSVDYFIEKFGKELGTLRWQEISRSKSVTLEKFIEKLGYDGGVAAWEDHKKKMGHDLRFFIEKYGEELGNKKYKSFCDTKRKNTKLEYWIEVCAGDVAAAKEKLAERQTTFSLNKCILKYGPEEGLKKWNARQEKWQNTLKSKPIEEQIEIQKRKFHYLDGRSKVADNLFLEISDMVKIKYPNIDQKMHFSENEWFLYDYKDSCVKFFDFKFKDKLIEFNGDYWHCNPKDHDPDFYNMNRKLKASEIWEIDDDKIRLAIENGFDIMVIWEGEYREDPEKTKNKIMTFLLEENI